MSYTALITCTCSLMLWVIMQKVWSDELLLSFCFRWLKTTHRQFLKKCWCVSLSISLPAVISQFKSMFEFSFPCHPHAIKKDHPPEVLPTMCPRGPSCVGKGSWWLHKSQNCPFMSLLIFKFSEFSSCFILEKNNQNNSLNSVTVIDHKQQKQSKTTPKVESHSQPHDY